MDTSLNKVVKTLLKKYKKTPHPLHYKNIYQLIVMVILSAQHSDKLINQLAEDLFIEFPNMNSLAKATPEDLFKHISTVRNFSNKANWITALARNIKNDRNIPHTMEGLLAHKGIGRKSANVVLRESGMPAQGIVVDLHVIRVAPRLGIAKGTNPNKIEKQMMKIIPRRQWDVGIAISFLGREICRPKPKCSECFMKNLCEYYKANH